MYQHLIDYHLRMARLYVNANATVSEVHNKCAYRYMWMRDVGTQCRDGLITVREHNLMVERIAKMD